MLPTYGRCSGPCRGGKGRKAPSKRRFSRHITRKNTRTMLRPMSIRFYSSRRVAWCILTRGSSINLLSYGRKTTTFSVPGAHVRWFSPSSTQTTCPNATPHMSKRIYSSRRIYSCHIRSHPTSSSYRHRVKTWKKAIFSLTSPWPTRARRAGPSASCSPFNLEHFDTRFVNYHKHLHDQREEKLKRGFGSRWENEIRVDQREKPRPRTVWKTSENRLFFEKVKNAPAFRSEWRKVNGNSKFMIWDCWMLVFAKWTAHKWASWEQVEKSHFWPKLDL